jgi:cell division protein ZapB
MTEAAEPKKGNKTTVIIALLTILVIIQGVKIYLDHQEKVATQTQLSSTEEELATTLQRMEELRVELDSRIKEIGKLGGDVAELEKAKKEIDAELKRTKRANGQIIKELKDRVSGYEQLLKDKDQEIEKLKSVNKELFAENRNLKTEKNQLGDSLNQLNRSKEELATKVAIASQLKAENLVVVALNEKGRERPSPFRPKQVQRLRVEFNIAENNVAPIEGKKILLRIVDENGQPLFDVARGSGTFMLDGREEFFTLAQEILFDNSRQKMSFLYEKGSEYAPGIYTAEIFTDGYKMGTQQFQVK